MIIHRIMSRTALGLIMSAAVMLGLLLSTGSADDPPKPDNKKDAAQTDNDGAEKPDEDPLRKARVQFLEDATKHFEVRVGEDQAEARRLPEPVMVYNNPVSGTKLGILTVFTRNGRPDVMAQFSFSAPQLVIHEFHNLCSEKVVMTRDSSQKWSPAETSTKWTPLTTTEKPAATPALRLIQMRRLAEKFTVEDNFGWEEKEKVRHELRLLSTPVHRYGKTDEPVIDGAVFVYALATDPEAILMLECVRQGSGLAWQYAFGPMSIYALKAKLDGEVVWEIPERKQFAQPTSVQYVTGYRLAPGEKYPE